MIGGAPVSVANAGAAPQMWDGHLGTVAATTHRIEVTAGSKPVHCQPYRAGARARSAEKEEIDRMLAEQ
jgi:hypothetical protein